MFRYLSASGKDVGIKKVGSSLSSRVLSTNRVRAGKRSCKRGTFRLSTLSEDFDSMPSSQVAQLETKTSASKRKPELSCRRADSGDFSIKFTLFCIAHY